MAAGYETLETDEKVTNTSIGSMKYGSYIIMGKDKNNKTTPYGNTPVPFQTSGKCYEAGSIDLFVGLNKMNLENIEEEFIQNSDGKQIKKYLSSDFMKDSARIYISERADPDEYFNIHTSAKSGNYKDLSTVCLVADAVRIMGRNNVKIVTAKTGAINSKGDSSFAAGGIHLIAGNNSENLQPIVKGDNLKKYLQITHTNNSNLAEMIQKMIIEELMPMWQFLSLHTHPTTGPGSPTLIPTPVPATPNFSNIGAGFFKKSLKLLSKTQNDTLIGKSYLKLESVKPLEEENKDNYILSSKNMVN